ncbi:MAG: peroxide stress protein YaaA [Ilumatobacteraceae bacterium]
MTTRTSPLTILLPPSEGKAPGGGDPAWSPDHGTYGETLAAHRQEVIDALAAAGGGDRTLLGVGGDHLERAVHANRSLLGAPTLPAWRRYTGVVWDHLDPATLTAAQRRSIVVVSGLLGLVRADDPVPDYRLKMGASLAPMGKLSTWWRPMLGPALTAASRRRAVVDLLPKEHRAAFSDEERGRFVTVDLAERSGAPGGHAAKAAKGRLARHLLTCGLPLDDALAAWTDDRFEVVTAR